MMYVFLGAAVCLCAPTLTLVLGWTYPTLGRPGTGFLVDLGGVSLAGQLNLLAFVCYELLVGIFWPSMMKLRAKHVPDEVRATVINIFRMPVNLFVCLVLFKSGVLSVQVMFILCAAMNVVAAVALRWVAASSGPEYQRQKRTSNELSQSSSRPSSFHNVIIFISSYFFSLRVSSAIGFKNQLF
jgi:MFS transporter, MFS domain-containing protein family, molybdate-anion transporter